MNNEERGKCGQCCYCQPIDIEDINTDWYCELKDLYTVVDLNKLCDETHTANHGGKFREEYNFTKRG